MARSIASQIVRDHGKKANGTARAATPAATEMSSIGGFGQPNATPEDEDEHHRRSGPGRC